MGVQADVAFGGLRPVASCPRKLSMKNTRYCVLACGFVIGFGSLNGALVIESRQTLLQVSTQFGYVGSVNSATSSVDYHGLASDLQSQLSGSDSGSGALGDTSWVATYEYRLDQSIEYVSGGIAASGSVSAFAFAGDQGVASVDAMTGNRLELGISLARTEAYRFSGIIQDLTSISFERSLGGGLWAPVVEPGTGAFDYTLELQAGQYRMSGTGGGYHSSSQGEGSSWSFQLVAVPEPPAVAVVTASLLLSVIVSRRLLPRSKRCD